MKSKINRRELRFMKTNGIFNSTALVLAALILFISLLSSPAIAALPNSAGIVNVKFITSPTTVSAPLTVNFYDQTTFGTGGVINNRYWDFGDGTYSSWWTGTGSSSLNKNPTHTYHTPGEYEVTLIEGATFPTQSPFEGYYNDSLSTQVIKVLKTPVVNKPVAAFSASPTSGSILLKVQFTDQSTNNPTSWKWDFGDGTTSTTHNPLHTITKSNYIKVIAPEKPVAAFSASPTSGSIPLKVQFTDQSTNNPTSWKWDFGDGTTSTTHNPLQKSNYIKVTVPVKPVAAFSASPISGKAPLTVKFTDKSTSNPTSWTWIFGDGSTSKVQNPVHKYTKKGTNTVSLTVKNVGGSSSVTKSKYIIVK